MHKSELSGETKYGEVISFLDHHCLIACRADEFLKKTAWLYDEDETDEDKHADALYEMLLDMIASYHNGMPLTWHGGIV